MKNSLHSSAGEIVFGMEDGAVSIFGLVLGVAVGAQSGSAVFLAGATAVIAASVSMIAGLNLDIEFEKAEARVKCAAAGRRDQSVISTVQINEPDGRAEGNGPEQHQSRYDPE